MTQFEKSIQQYAGNSHVPERPGAAPEARQPWRLGRPQLIGLGMVLSLVMVLGFTGLLALGLLIGRPTPRATLLVSVSI